MELISKKENKIVFKTDLNQSLANAIRRYVNQIPVLAIDEVEISKNGSALYDEVVAHRIGLIPLKMDKTKSEKTTTSLKLSSKKEGFVNSGELKGSIDPVYDNIPITFLDKGQEIDLVANVKAGKGVDHVKFSPGIMFYREVSELVFDKSLVEEVKKVCGEKCNIKEKGSKMILVDDGENDIASVVEGIADKAKKEIEVESKPELIVSLESFGQIGVDEIFKKSIDAVKADLSDVSKALK